MNWRSTGSTVALLAVLILLMFAGAAPLLGQSSEPAPPTTSAANTPPPPPNSSTTAASSSSAGGSSSATNAAVSAEPKKAGQARGIVASVKFEGSSNADGQVMDINSSTGFNFNRWFGVDIGMPFYIVRASPSSASPSTTVATTGTGLGNLYMDARLHFENPVLNYGTTITGTAPTGSQELGHSTGHWTWDWSNHFDHSFGRVTPFADAGLGNSVTDTFFFQRPFTTLGYQAHFEAGLGVDIWGPFSASASLYDVAPWGQQTVFSRLVSRSTGNLGGTAGPRRQYERDSIVVGGPELVRDNGYHASLSFTPTSYLSFEVGFSHSVPLALNTVSWGVAFNISDAVKHRPAQ